MSREAFNQLWATAPTDPGNDASFSVPRPAIFATGWEGGADKDAPKAGEQNWWQNRADFALQSLERYGAMTWDADAVYSAGAPTYASDNNYYESLANSNSGNDPTGTTGYWRLIGGSLFNIVPVGAILSIAHSGVPDTGWLKCNGAVVTRATYSRLFDKIGTSWNSSGESTQQFRLPDLRGEFLRGFDDSRGIDVNRIFASLQLDAFKNHNHNPLVSYGPNSGSISGVFNDVQAGRQGTSVQYVSGSAGGSYISNTGDIETRPRNRAVNFWIKY